MLHSLGANRYGNIPEGIFDENVDSDVIWGAGVKLLGRVEQLNVLCSFYGF